MPGSLPTNWCDPLNWGTSTGGASGQAETINTLGADRLDNRVPPDQYRIGGLQISQCKNLLISISTFYKGGTRLQCLIQNSSPFGVTEYGWWVDANGNPRFSAGGVAYQQLTQVWPRKVVAASSYTASASDWWLDVNFAGAVAITLPQTPTTGTVLFIKDASGAAATNNITINAGTGDAIEGTASKVITTNYGWYGIFYNGSTAKWEVLSSAAAYIEVDGIGTAQTPGLWLVNKTAAANSAQQFSPSLRFIGQGWQTTTPASEQSEIDLQLRPVQAATHANLDLVFWTSQGGGALAERLAIQFAPGASVTLKGAPSETMYLQPGGAFIVTSNGGAGGLTYDSSAGLRDGLKGPLGSSTFPWTNFWNAGSFSSNQNVQTGTSYTAGPNDFVVVMTNAAARTFTLPPASLFKGLMIILKDGSGAGTGITAQRAGSDTIFTTTSGNTSVAVSAQGASAWFIADGTSTWYVLKNGV